MGSSDRFDFAEFFGFGNKNDVSDDKNGNKNDVSDNKADNKNDCKKGTSDDRNGNKNGVSDNRIGDKTDCKHAETYIERETFSGGNESKVLKKEQSATYGSGYSGKEAFGKDEVSFVKLGESKNSEERREGERFSDGKPEEKRFSDGNSVERKVFGGKFEEEKAYSGMREDSLKKGEKAEFYGKNQRNTTCGGRAYGDVVALGEDSSAGRILAKEGASSIYGSGVNVAVENDWLELSYVQRKYGKTGNSEENDKESGEFREEKGVYGEKNENDESEKAEESNCEENAGAKIGRGAKNIGKRLGKRGILAASLALIIILAAFCAFSFGGADATEWWTAVKKQALGVFGINAKENKLVLSAISTVGSVDGGDIVINGGTLAVALVGGKVKTVTDSSVTVEFDADTEIVYGLLKDVKVISGQVLSCYDILGYYDESYVVNVISKGKKVENVAVIGNSIVWEV